MHIPRRSEIYTRWSAYFSSTDMIISIILLPITWSVVSSLACILVARVSWTWFADPLTVLVLSCLRKNEILIKLYVIEG